MNYLDIILAIALLWGLYKGISKGIVKELAALIALIAGIYGAVHFADNIHPYLKEQFAIESSFLPIVSFAITFIVIVLAVKLVGFIIDKIVKAEKEYEKEMAPFRRKGRILDAGLEFLNYALTSPKIFKDLRRETDYAVRRGLQAELRRQSMPDAVQARMLAGSQGFATEAEAIAKQQQAATELAKAGIRPSTATFSA